MCDDWEGDEASERQLADKEIARLKELHVNAAFRDAISKAQESVLQPSFAEGFRNGKKCGVQWGMLHGMAASLQEMAQKNGDAALGAETSSILAQLEANTPEHEDAGLYKALGDQLDALLLVHSRSKNLQ